MKKEHLEWLQANKACGSSIQWIEEKNIQSLEEVWHTCERGDWLLWIATKLNVDKRKLVLCAALCAHMVVRMQDARSRDAVRVAFLWGRGKATDEQLSSARKAAWGAACGSGATAAAALAADAAAALAADADGADSAVRAAALAIAWTAADADAATDKKSNQLRTAEIARKILTNDVMKKIKEIK